jgi:hypothetical protein
VADRHNVGVVTKAIDHCLEQAAREHRRTEIADALRIDRIMGVAVSGAPPHLYCQLEALRLADLCALFARDRLENPFLI